jgi:uncharacterized protein (TIGR00369 family)
MEMLPNSKSCFVCGMQNPSGLQLQFHAEGNIVHTRFTPRTQYNGFVGVVHGGILATVLDEIMVWACAVQTGSFSYCAELNVRYVRSAQPNDPLHVSAHLVENKRGRLFLAESEIKNEAEQVIATATGKYMPIKNLDLTTLAADFGGDHAQLTNLLKRASEQS